MFRSHCTNDINKRLLTSISAASFSIYDVSKLGFAPPTAATFCFICYTVGVMKFTISGVEANRERTKYIHEF